MLEKLNRLSEALYLTWIVPIAMFIVWAVDLATGHRDVIVAFVAGVCAKSLSETIVKRRRHQE
jgi:hypothetical protein